MDQLVEQGHVKRLSDIFALEIDTVMGLERMGEKSAANLIESLDRAKQTTLARFLIALGMRHVGAGVAELLADRFGDLDPLLATSREELEAIDGIGPTIAESVTTFCADARNAAEIRRARELGVRWPVSQPSAASGDALAGKTFVVTGSLATMTREEAKRQIRGQGGRVTGSVSKKTDFVVIGTDPGRKAREAEKLGIETLDEAAFERILARANHTR